MKRFAPRLVLLLALAALAGPSVAAAQAASEGLLLEVLTATTSRQRTKQDPSRRPLEDRALVLANLAGRLPGIVAHTGTYVASERPTAFEPPLLQRPAAPPENDESLTPASSIGTDSIAALIPTASSSDRQHLALPISLDPAPRPCVHPVRFARSCAPRAPPSA